HSGPHGRRSGARRIAPPPPVGGRISYVRRPDSRCTYRSRPLSDGWGLPTLNPAQPVGAEEPGTGMQNNPVCKVSYRRSRFSTRLPDDRRYTASHYWLLEVEPGTWRVGFTQFATRMLGDLVEHGFEVKPGAAVELGDTVGWIE